MTTPTVPLTSTRKGAPSPVSEHRPSTGAASAPPQSTANPRLGSLALTLLRLALGVEFLWAFFDKLFGLHYSTPTARAWINGGSPTKGFLSNVQSGPLRDFFHSIAGAPAANWLFMLGLLGIGSALILGVALRPAAACGAVLLAMMWLATWPIASMAAGQPTGSTNPVVDDHVISALALVVVGVFAARGAGFLGRR